MDIMDSSYFVPRESDDTSVAHTLLVVVYPHNINLSLYDRPFEGLMADVYQATPAYDYGSVNNQELYFSAVKRSYLPRSSKHLPHRKLMQRVVKFAFNTWHIEQLDYVVVDQHNDPLAPNSDLCIHSGSKWLTKHYLSSKAIVHHHHH